MIPIIGKPILEHIIDFLTFNKINNIYIVVNNKMDTIVNYFGDGQEFGATIQYIVQEKLNGIAMAINLSKELIEDDFLCILGDTFIRKQNIGQMVKKFYEKDAVVVQALSKESDPTRIIQSCNVITDNEDRILDIIEKPKEPLNRIRGAGLYIFKRDLFDYLTQTKKSSLRNEVEISDTIRYIAELKKAYGYWLEYSDVNINEEIDIKKATLMALGLEK